MQQLLRSVSIIGTCGASVVLCLTRVIATALIAIVLHVLLASVFPA